MIAFELRSGFGFDDPSARQPPQSTTISRMD